MTKMYRTNNILTLDIFGYSTDEYKHVPQEYVSVVKKSFRTYAGIVQDNAF